MDLSSLNPLSYFKEFTVFPRVVFWIGAIFFGVGVSRGISLDNELLFLSFVILSFALGAHYFSRCIWYESSPPYKIRLHWDRVSAGLIMLIVTFFFYQYLSNLHQHHQFLDELKNQPK